MSEQIQDSAEEIKSKAEKIKELASDKPRTIAPLSPTTTVQEDVTKASQRRINLIWESTQAVIAVSITWAVIYCSIKKIETEVLTNAFFLIVAMYYVRTNHKKTGGIDSRPSAEQRNIVPISLLLNLKISNMQKETILSLFRTLLSVGAAFLIGKNVFGSPLDSETWQIVVGIIVGIGSAVWGIFDKTATTEMIQSAIRSAFVFVGGLLVAKGQWRAEDVNMWLGVIAAIGPFIDSWLQRRKAQRLKEGSLVPNQLAGNLKN